MGYTYCSRGYSVSLILFSVVVIFQGRRRSFLFFYFDGDCQFNVVGLTYRLLPYPLGGKVLIREHNKPIQPIIMMASELMAIRVGTDSLR